MGVTNLCKLLRCFKEPVDKPVSFDSILLDAQSYLYIAIERALENTESKFFNEICKLTWKYFKNDLYCLLRLAAVQSLTVVVSFDGEGVPMKWPTQRKRRSSDQLLKRHRTFYSCSLFGKNRLALMVETYFIERMKRLKNIESIRDLKFIVCGCSVPGEGEHKLFHVAQTCGLRRPIVSSVDQDVFVIALAQLKKFDRIQIYRYDHFYDVHEIEQKMGSEDAVNVLETVSFLFGNDFVPALVNLTDQNVQTIAACLEAMAQNTLCIHGTDILDCDKDDEEYEYFTDVTILASFLNAISSKIRFENVAHVDENLVAAFWTTYLWVRDYYRKRHFPQKYILNTLYDAFDRNQILTALTNLDLSNKIFTEAHERYHSCQETKPFNRRQIIRQVFVDEAVVKHLMPYWMLERDESFDEKTCCKVVRLTKE